MIPLDQLVAAAQAKVATGTALAKAKDKARTAKTSSARDEALAQVHAIQDRIEWTPSAVVFRAEQWHCACGCVGSRPVGLFTLLEHVRLANTLRFQAIRHGEPVPPLPKRYHTESVRVEMCELCAPYAGFTSPYHPPPTPEQRALALRQPGQYIREWQERRSPNWHPSADNLEH